MFRQRVAIEGDDDGSDFWRTLKWWPSLAGLAFATFVAQGRIEGASSGPALSAAGVVYLGSAALGAQWTAWPLFILTVAVIILSEIGNLGFDATWWLLGIGAALFVYGLWRRAGQSASALPMQSVALLAFGGAAAMAMALDPRWAAILIAAGLFAHSGWDFYHHRRNIVVSRSLAEFCFVLDATLAALILIATFPI